MVQNIPLWGMGVGIQKETSNLSLIHSLNVLVKLIGVNKLPNVFIVSYVIPKCVREIIRGSVMCHYLRANELIQDPINNLCNHCRMILALHMLMLFCFDLVVITNKRLADVARRWGGIKEMLLQGPFIQRIWEQDLKTITKIAMF